MTRWSWPIARVFGIEIRVHATFGLLLIWLAAATWSESRSAATVGAGVVLVVALFGSVILHELGHALTARRFGIATRDIILLPIGGVARLERMPERPRDEILVAAAGPLVSFTIAGVLAAVLASEGVSLGVAGALEPGGSLLQRVYGQNLMLGLFNLLPAFPMDGGRLLRAGLALRLDPVRATRIAAAVGRALALGLGFAGLMGNPVLVFIALFVWIGGGLEAAEVALRAVIRDLPTSSAMVTDFRSLAADDPLERAVALTLSGTQRDFPVLHEGRLHGILTQAGLLAGLTSRGARSPVSASMRPDPPQVSEAAPLADVLPRLQTGGWNVAAVVRDGQLAGVIDLENILELIRIRTALQSTVSS